MNNIYITSISVKRQTGDFIIKKEHYHIKQYKEIVNVIKDIFQFKGIERVSKELKGFLHNFPDGAYVKFTLKLDHDFSVISSGGGLLGYISDAIYDAYDTFSFSNVDYYLPSKPLKSIDELKSKWSSIQQILPLLEYKNNPSILQSNKDYSTKIDYSRSIHHSHTSSAPPPNPIYLSTTFSPKQMSTQHTSPSIEKDFKLSSSPKSTSNLLKSKVQKEGVVGSPPLRAF